MKIIITVHTNRDGIDVPLPAKWVVCPDCDGRAVTTRHIECDGGGFTASEFDEICHDDPDFEVDYFGGVYDRPCPTCDGRSTIQVIDEEAVTGWRERIFLKAYREQERDNREIDAMHDAERRMGA